VVTTLLDNARVHAPGATVVVDVREASDHLRIVVADDGAGVPPHLARRLFQYGVRGPGSPGEGIGLTYARRLAREAGGDLLLEAPGSRFVLVVPPAGGDGAGPAHDLDDARVPGPC
jgi:signal transduction histidine kinase